MDQLVLNLSRSSKLPMLLMGVSQGDRHREKMRTGTSRWYDGMFNLKAIITALETFCEVLSVVWIYGKKDWPSESKRHPERRLIGSTIKSQIEAVGAVSPASQRYPVRNERDESHLHWRPSDCGLRGLLGLLQSREWSSCGKAA